MIDFAETYNIKTPGGTLHKVFSRLHRMGNAMVLFPQPVHKFHDLTEIGSYNLVGNIHDPREIRLAVMSDLHLQARKSVAHLKAAVKELGRLDPRPDAVIVTGDIAQIGRERSYHIFAEQMKSLDGVPYFVIPGNHDLRGLMHRRYQRILDRPLDYSIDCGPVRLLMVGSCDHHVQDEALAWVDRELAEHSNVPHLMFLHYHPLPITFFSSPRLLGKWLDCALLDNTNDLMRVIMARGNVPALFHGHGHLGIRQRLGGIDIIGTGSISSHQPGQTRRPSYRLVTFSEGTMRTVIKFVDGPIVGNEVIHVVDDIYRS